MQYHDWIQQFGRHLMEILSEVDDKLAHVAEDFGTQMTKAETLTDIENNYELTDGQVITMVMKNFVVLKYYLHLH